jgi:hypothetical protein
MDYTKAPWKMSEVYRDFSIGDHRIILGADGRIVCHVWPDSNSQTDANARLIIEAPAMHKVLERVLFITHNDGIGLSAITGKEDGTNRVVFTPAQLNEIGDTIRAVLAKVEGK